MDQKRIPVWQWAIIALVGFLLWQVIMNAQAIAVMALARADLFEQSKTWLPAITALVALVLALGFFHILYLWPGRGIATIGMTSQKFGSDAALGVIVGLAQAAISLFVVIPALGESARDVLSAVGALWESPERLLAAIVLVVVYGGIVEEMFFRGHIIRALGHALGNRAWSVAAAGVISVALFAAAHRHQGEIGIVYAAAAGAIYAALYLLTNRLTASMSAHATYDLTALLGIYFLYPELVASS